MKAYTIHGMNTSDRGAAGMDRLAGVLREADIFEALGFGSTGIPEGMSATCTTSLNPM